MASYRCLYASASSVSFSRFSIVRMYTAMFGRPRLMAVCVWSVVHVSACTCGEEGVTEI